MRDVTPASKLAGEPPPSLELGYGKTENAPTGGGQCGSAGESRSGRNEGAAVFRNRQDHHGAEADADGGGTGDGSASADGVEAEGLSGRGVFGGAADAVADGAGAGCGDRDSSAGEEEGCGAGEGGWGDLG